MTLICEFSNNLYYLDNEYGPFLDRKSSGTITRRGINYDKVVQQLDACAACYIAAHSGPLRTSDVKLSAFFAKQTPTCQIQIVYGDRRKNVSKSGEIKIIIFTLLKTRLINCKNFHNGGSKSKVI